jgi:hypothetical protein
VDWVSLASCLIACNLGCDPQRENKVLVPILFLIGEKPSGQFLGLIVMSH